MQKNVFAEMSISNNFLNNFAIFLLGHFNILQYITLNQTYKRVSLQLSFRFPRSSNKDYTREAFTKNTCNLLDSLSLWGDSPIKGFND